MLQSLSDGIRNSRWLGWLVVGLITIPFALWGIGSYLGVGAEPYVAKVNGVEISAREYERAYNQQRAAISRQFGGRLPPALADAEFIKTQTVDGLINRELLIQTLTDNGYRVADATVRDEVLNANQFKIDGRFDKDAYERQVSSMGMSTQQYEDQLRQALALEQMRSGIAETAFYSPSELESIERLRKQQRKVVLLSFPAEKFRTEDEVSEERVQEYHAANAAAFFVPEAVRLEYLELDQNRLADTVTVDEDTLRQHYEEQKQRFSTPGRRFARHILVKTDASMDEAARAERLAHVEALRARIEAGESFEDLAREFSEDPGSAKQGGDLGEVPRGIMVQPFEEALYALDEGELSAPVKSTFGYHLIEAYKVEPGTTQTFEEVREQLRRELQLREAENLFFDRVDVLANEAYENSDALTPAAEATGLPLKTSEWIERDRGEGIGADPAVRNTAFSPTVLDDRLNSDLVELGANHVAVVRVIEYRTRAPRPLEDVREEVIAAIREADALAGAQAAATEALAALRAGEAPQSVAERLGAELSVEEALARNAPGVEPAVREAVFRLPRPAAGAASYAQVSDSQGNPVVLALQDVMDSPAADETQTASAADEQSREVQNLGNREYGAWLEVLRRQAQIERREGLL